MNYSSNYITRIVLQLMMVLTISCAAFADPVIISGGPGNDYESWIARIHTGRLMTVFCRNPDWQSGDLYVAFSDDDGLTWSDPEAIITGAGDQATLSFVQTPSDTIRLYYASKTRMAAIKSTPPVLLMVSTGLPRGWLI